MTWVFALIFLGTLKSYSQNLPPVARYNTEDYGADNQNWSVTQTADQSIFFANGKGLLKFDGEQWKLLGSPNNTILRSVYAVGNDIYSGAYMDFGVWKKDNRGIYRYTSLSNDIKLIEDEQFWKITALKDFIVFQSLDAIYIYNLKNKTFEIIRAKKGFTKMVVVDNILYFHKSDEGIFKMVNGKEILVNSNEIFKKCTLVNIYKIDNELYAQTQFNGIINLNSLDKYIPLGAGGKWDDLSVYSSLQNKSNGDIFLGTISHGFIKISNNKIVYNLNQKNTLSNNTVLSMYRDISNNVWLGLDNGINSINDYSGISIFNDTDGQLGTIYATIKHKELIYVGSNQGLFYFDNQAQKFKLVNGTNGQVWSLFSSQETLFCGHHNGTYVVNKDTASLLEGTAGTWTFRRLNDNTILSGNYEGLYVYKYENNAWKFDRKINGFDISTQFFEFIDPTTVLVNHEYKGIFKLKLDNSLSKVNNYNTIKSIEKGLFSSIIKYQNKIFYAYQDGVYFFNNETNSFQKDTSLTKIINAENFSSGKMIKTDDNKLWFFNKTDIVNVTISSLKNQFSISKIPISEEERHQISGYENVSLISPGMYLLGKSNGYLKINTNEISKIKANVFISKVTVKDMDENEIPDFELSDIDYIHNNISIQLTSYNFNTLFNSEYQYKLMGYNDKWSEWQPVTQINLKNLPQGEYSLLVRSRLGEDNLSEILTLEFNINRPFYFSIPALIIYILIIILIGFLFHYFNKQYYKKQRQNIEEEAERKLKLKELESQKEIMDINNKKLKLDIENKNRELAISTMSLIKKNEFLSKIKSDLKPIKTNNNLAKKVINSIDKNINSKDDWQFFEEAFNNADKDFFKKLKENHPALTHNDFKLCAYLRLNLSSKEIAPLFNISTKSVEIKRYRLRKKMDLDRDQSLTDYILSL